MIKRGINRRLAEVGKIKIGGKGETKKSTKGTTYQIPVKYDHFVITTTERDLKTGNFIQNKKIMDILGPEPKEIKIRFLYDDIDLNFFTSYALYGSRKQLCRGDGFEAMMTFQQSGTPGVFTLIDGGAKKVVAGETRKIICDPATCPMMTPDQNGATRCKPSGILSCVLADSPEIGGVYRFRTHSWNTIEGILGSLELLKTQTGGVLVGLPLKMKLVKKSTEEHGNINTVTIVFDGEGYAEMRHAAMIEMDNRTKHRVNMRLLEDQARDAGFNRDLDDPADVEAEFYTVSEPRVLQPQSDDIADRVPEIEDEDAAEDVPEDEAIPETKTEQEEQGGLF